MSKNHPELSIIIVNYNTRHLLRSCLSSLHKKNHHTPWHIMVIDNGSTDGSAKMLGKEFPSVELILNRRNLGFAKANNQGITKAVGEYVLLLNSDTEATPAAITATLRYLEERPEVGVATCKLVRPDGSLDPACHRGFPTPWASLTYFLGLEKLFGKSKLFGQYHQGYQDLSQPHEIDSPSGAFFMVRKVVIDQVGLLDERFFMYGEDLDWSYRIKQAGWKIMFYPYVSILHKKWQSGKVHQDALVRRETQKHFFSAMQLFYKKHYQHRYGWLLTGCVLLGIKLRSFFNILVGNFGKTSH